MSLVNAMEGQKCVIRTPGSVRLIFLCILRLLFKLVAQRHLNYTL